MAWELRQEMNLERQKIEHMVCCQGIYDILHSNLHNWRFDVRNVRR